MLEKLFALIVMGLIFLFGGIVIYALIDLFADALESDSKQEKVRLFSLLILVASVMILACDCLLSFIK